MYHIPVKIEGIERRRKSTGLLHIVAGLFLITSTSTYFKLLQYENFLAVFPLYIIAAASVIYGLLRTKIDPKARYNHWLRIVQCLAFAVLSILLLQAEIEFRNFVLLAWAAICILLLFSERKVFHDAFLSFEKKGMSLPGYFANWTLSWNTLQNVVVRNDYVTIFLTEDKYRQLEVLAELSEREIIEINNFCQQQLKEKQIEQV